MNASPLAEPSQRPHKSLPVLSAAETLGLPSGWFVVATSADLARGRTLTTRFMSEELVLYRTASGEARAVSPYCPHLGAHLGHCGTVEGETLRCDYHHFRFDGRGACTRTGYGTRPPPAARLGTRPVREQHGVILVYHDPAGNPPSWEVPALDVAGWSPLVFRTLSLRGHPQETAENGVDVGHFSLVHGFSEVRVIEEARTRGPYLRARYGMKRPLGPLARFGVGMDVAFTVHCHGFGYALAEADVPQVGLRTRQFIFSTPTEPGRIDLRLGVSVQHPTGLGALLARPAADAIASIIAGMYVNDVQHDVRIWEHKRYLPRPALAEGDGPVGLYRKWAKQFYPSGAEPSL